MTPSQRRMLRHLDKWGELGPDAEDELRLYGAALYAVLAAVERRGWIAERPGPVSGIMDITAEGRRALNEA